MKLICSVIALFIGGIFNPAFTQSKTPAKILIDVSTGEVYELKGESVSGFKTVVIRLPEKDFQNIKINISNNAQLGFKCDDKDKNCHLINASDIDSGRILLHFTGKVLSSIGNRVFSYTKDVLSGKDTLRITGISKPLITPVSFVPASGGKDEPPRIETRGYNSKFCKDTSNNGQTVNGIPDLSFLCPEIAGKKDCPCGVPIKNGFENMYLPPCFDKKGNAISVKNHVLYDMSATDPLQKVFLFEIKKASAKKNNSCSTILDGSHFQYAKIKTRMSPGVENIMAVSVIAHKDSVIIIDSNSRNYFLDSATAVQAAFTAAGSKGKTSDSTLHLDGGGKDSVYFLRAAVVLRSDLVYFNNYYRDLAFVQEKYNVALACLQVKITEVFFLNNVPRTGNDLASAIERWLPDTLRVYRRFACLLLNQIASEYDSAVNRRSNYRIYTQLLQIPNADELGIGIKTSKSTTSLYGHKFNIKGGIKIDFSTGIFVTGLNSSENILTSLRFRIRDSATAPTTRDTVGNLILPNEDKLNFSTGFLVHVYRRSGHWINTGMVAGATVSNSEFMMLLGGSIMFRMGNGRLSLVGGWAFGKQKALDANHQKYLYNANQFPTNQVYNKDQLPRFFTDTNISTYEKRQRSWFAGITYNFASIKL